MGTVAGPVIWVRAEGTNRATIFSDFASALPDVRCWLNPGYIISFFVMAVLMYLTDSILVGQRSSLASFANIQPG